MSIMSIIQPIPFKADLKSCQTEIRMQVEPDHSGRDNIKCCFVGLTRFKRWNCSNPLVMFWLWKFPQPSDPPYPPLIKSIMNFQEANTETNASSRWVKRPSSSSSSLQDVATCSWNSLINAEHLQILIIMTQQLIVLNVQSCTDFFYQYLKIFNNES